MWHLLASWLLFALLTMVSQSDLSGEGVCKPWLLFSLLNLLIQRASVICGGRGLPMAGFLAKQSTCVQVYHRWSAGVISWYFCLPFVLIRWWPVNIACLCCMWRSRNSNGRLLSWAIDMPYRFTIDGLPVLWDGIMAVCLFWLVGGLIFPGIIPQLVVWLLPFFIWLNLERLQIDVLTRLLLHSKKAPIPTPTSCLLFLHWEAICNHSHTPARCIPTCTPRGYSHPPTHKGVYNAGRPWQNWGYKGAFCSLMRYAIRSLHLRQFITLWPCNRNLNMHDYYTSLQAETHECLKS